MAFGSKDTGVNNTTKKQLKELVKSGYSAVEISNQIQVELVAVVSWMKHLGASKEQIGDLTEYASADALELAKAQVKLNEAANQIDSDKSEMDRLKSLLEAADIDYEGTVA